MVGMREHEGGSGIDFFGHLELGVGGTGGYILEQPQLWYKPRKSGLTVS